LRQNKIQAINFERMKKIYFLLLLLLSLHCGAQFREFHFNHLTIKNGLPENTEIAMLQDKEGYIWIGTQSGLVRFDGYSTKAYGLNMPGKLPSQVNTIHQDAKGRLWIGTDGNGLFTYDRAADSFTRFAYYGGDMPMISGNSVFYLKSDTLNNIWLISYNAQSNKYFIDVIITANRTAKHLQTKTRESDEGLYPGVTILDYLVQKDGQAWIGTDSGMYRYQYRSGKLTKMLPTAQQKDQQVFWGLFEDPGDKNQIWMFSRSRASYLDQNPLKGGASIVRYNIPKNSFDIFQHDAKDKNSIDGEKFTAFQKDSMGNLWVGSPAGLCEFDNASSHFINYEPADKKDSFVFFETGGDPLPGLIADKEGNIWYKTSTDLYFFNKSTKKFIHSLSNKNAPDRLPISIFPNLINDLLISKDGSLWVGMRGFGVHWLNRNRSKFSRYQVTNDIDNKYNLGKIECFAQGTDSSFWLASDRGLYHWFPSADSFAAVKIVNDFKHRFKYDLPFRGITTDHQGNLWVSLLGNGLLRYDPAHNRIVHFSYDMKDSNSVCGKIVRYVFEDHLGRIWIGTNESGICSYNPKTGRFTRYPSLNNLQINCIHEDSSGTIWAGVYGNLFFLLPGQNNFTPLANPYEDFGETICIHEDAERLWVGTHLGAGVIMVDKKSKTLSRISIRDGLPSNDVLGIYQDGFKRKWLLSSDRLTILDPKTNSFSILSTKNGLPDFSAGGFTKFYKTREGKFLIGCDDGFIVFDPQQFFPDTAAPIIHIETLSFQNTRADRPRDSILSVIEKNTIQLKHDENKLSFHYTGLQYQYSELNQYAYKLDGYDKDWVQAGSERTVTYNNLAPGTYTFHVKAANSDGIWGTKDDEITLVISPPWWRTWWAYVLYVAAFIGALWAFIYLRGRRLIKENRMLEQKIKIRTTQVMQQKEELTQQRDNLEKTLVELKSTQSQLIHSEKMASLGELTAGIAHEIQNPLNFVNNFSEVNNELIEELKNQKSKLKNEEQDEILKNIFQNNEKINLHGRRADAIVKGMLQHSRSSTAVKEPIDINALADEYLRLAYHGLRAKEKSFKVTLKTDFDKSIGTINMIPQDIGRVLLNLYNNAFYAVDEKKKSNELSDVSYDPLVSVQTKKINGKVVLTVMDNGNGIPQNIVDKIFQPFFTTKPTGQGTGLGLSLSYDIIKTHGGEIKVNTKEGEGSQFIFELPS